MTRALPYLYLALAIAFEVVGTSALKASETLTRLVPSLVSLIAYTASFVFLALSLRTIPIGISYAMWAGLGIVLIALVGWFWFRQTLDVPALIGLALIVGGVFLVNAFSQSLPHILTSPRHVRFTPRTLGGASKSAFGCRFIAFRKAGAAIPVVVQKRPTASRSLRVSPATCPSC